MSAAGVLVTGTTSGIGRALVEYYDRRHVHVVAVNRRFVDCTSYSTVHHEQVDVRSADAVASLVGRLAAADQLPHTFILNAGINRVDNDETFDLAAYEDVLATNLYGVLNFVAPLTRLRSPEGRRVFRRIIAVSSMAGFVGSPYGLGYHTSKRALSACFDVWSKMYGGTDLLFQQVLLGPVPTAMTTVDHRLPAWVARVRSGLSVAPDCAARAIAEFATTRRTRLYYPWRAAPLFLGVWAGRSLFPGVLQGRNTLEGKRRRTSGS